MALRLSAWLHNEFKTQLELGNNWLEDQNRRKAECARPSALVDKQWQGLYHDNGSCLDIVGPISAHQVRVLVLQALPLTITDGCHHTQASLTTTCLQDLHTRFPGSGIATGTVLAVRKHTIRYTPYGPPRDKLRLILNTVDWVGERCSGTCTDPTEPLHRSEDIASSLRQLHHTRTQEDHRCLRPQSKEEEDSDGGYIMAAPNESLDEDASMNTQMPFGTQVQHPIRSRRNDDEPQFVAINRLEPVLAGNTQRAELKPRSGNSALDKQKQAQLLSLLRTVQPPTAPQAHRTEAASEPTTLNHHAVTASPQPRDSPHKLAARQGTEAINAGAIPTQSDNGKKRVREVEDASRASQHTAKKTSVSEQEPEQSKVCEMDRFAAQCSWMKGLKLNRESTKVPLGQIDILSKPESWHKPQPGRRFPEANIPMQIFTALSRQADEKIALEAALDASSGSYDGTDPSTASLPPTSVPQPEDEQEVESEDDAPTSPVSWHTSPSPEPPIRPTGPRQGLPPDSSIEVLENVTEAALPHKPTVKREQSPQLTLPPSSNENELDAPPSSPPGPHASSHSDDEMEMETSVPHALGEDLDKPLQSHIPPAETCSRLVVQVKETPYVKRQNGQPVVTISPPTQESNSNENLENSSSASIVRGTYHETSSSAVEETRLDTLSGANGKDRHSHRSINLPAPLGQARELFQDNGNQDMSQCNMFVREEPLSNPTWQRDRQEQTQTNTVQEDILRQPEPTPMSAQLPPKNSSSGEQAAPTRVEDIVTVPIQPNTPPRQPSATPSLNKRKLETTPSKEGKRPSKHRRLIKIVSFGGGGSDALRQQRTESLRRAEDERRKSASVENQRGSVSNMSIQQDADTKMEDSATKEIVEPDNKGEGVVVEGNMSPRHQSLYDPPSPTSRPSAAPATVSAPESISVGQTEPEAPNENVVRPDTSEDHPQPQQTQPQPQSPPEPQLEAHSQPELVPEPELRSHPQPEANQSIAEMQAREEQPPPTAPVTATNPSTVFEAFKAAYPEYKGDKKHFRGQCTQMEELDQEDRMVPKWMWDDFIIRNRTDYKEYVVDCLDQSEEAMPYIRFYKDTIRDTLYKKGIIGTRATLLKALHELGVQPRTTQAQPAIQHAVQQPVRQSTHVHQTEQPVHRSPPHLVQQSPRQNVQRPARSSVASPTTPATSPPKKKPSRKSLPSAFAQPKNPAQAHLNSTPRDRHSLPASSTRTTQPPTPSRQPSTSKSRMSEVLARLPSASAQDEPANEYRNFLKAQPRLTSTTGSTRVSSTPPNARWPPAHAGAARKS